MLNLKIYLQQLPKHNITSSGFSKGSLKRNRNSTGNKQYRLNKYWQGSGMIELLHD